MILSGSSLPELVLPDLGGRMTSSRDFPGKAMLINVWATWCQPCRAEMAGLDRLYRSLSPQGLQLLGVSVDRRHEPCARIRSAGWRFIPCAERPKREKDKNRIIGTSAVPVSLLVARDGRVQRVVVGERGWDDGEARAWVSGLLG